MKKDASKNSPSSPALQTALAYYKSGQLPVAEEMCRKILHDDAKNAEALHMLGTIAAQSGRYEEAVTLLDQAAQIKKNDAGFFYDLALALQKWGKADEALLKYQKAVTLKPDYIEAHINIGDILQQQGRLDEAEWEYKHVIALKPDHAGAHYTLGNILSYRGKQAEAVVHYVEAVTRRPDLAEAHASLGKVLKKLGLINEAIVRYEHALLLQPRNPRLLTRLVDAMHHACAWEKMAACETQLLELVRQKSAGISPFTILGTPATAQDQLTCARSFHHDKGQPPQALFTHVPRKSGGRIRIGYLSADLQEHATAYLMAELFERHDRARFEITAYSYGQDDNSAMRGRLMKAFEKFIDVGALSDAAAAKKIYDDGVDILIDLKGGATKDARLGISAYRPAPVQVNYLGYPGTTGVSFIDYIIADRFIIPEDQEQFYSEKVVCLPDSYQPNDTHRKIAETVPTRAACGLPEQGFVFCCFNASYKITPQVFSVWMRLLQKVSGSVLWLLETNPSAKENLKQEALRHGVDPERIIFATRTPLPDHLARHRLADLFLDTLPINAHTTTSDALWAGLPVLTCAGSTFAGRVAGSLLKAADLPELITYSLEEYEALALQLALDPARLSAIRQKLERTRLQVPLFDIEKFTRNIEKSYQTMWDIRQSGEAPKAFSVL